MLKFYLKIYAPAVAIPSRGPGGTRGEPGAAMDGDDAASPA